MSVADGIESAMAQAKAAAGDREVQVRGAYTEQRALEAGVLGEVQIHLVPVLLGAGRRRGAYSAPSMSGMAFAPSRSTPAASTA